MEKTLPLSEEDTRGILRLLGDVAALEEGLDAQKQFVMEGLSKMVDADSWAWATTVTYEAEETPRNSGFISGGFTPEQFAKFQEALAHPETGTLNADFMRELEKRQGHVTRSLDQMNVADLFPTTKVYPIWIAAGIAQVIMSARPSKNGVLSHIGIYRRLGRPPFSNRESRIAHIILGEVPWLHDDVLPSELGATVTRLTPRQRIVLNLLLEGQDRRQIAAHLGLSLHTIDEYVRKVFEHFHVHSHTALIVRFQEGDGGDQP